MSASPTPPWPDDKLPEKWNNQLARPVGSMDIGLEPTATCFHETVHYNSFSDTKQLHPAVQFITTASLTQSSSTRPCSSLQQLTSPFDLLSFQVFATSINKVGTRFTPGWGRWTVFRNIARHRQVTENSATNFKEIKIVNLTSRTTIQNKGWEDSIWHLAGCGREPSSWLGDPGIIII